MTLLEPPDFVHDTADRVPIRRRHCHNYIGFTIKTLYVFLQETNEQRCQFQSVLLALLRVAVLVVTQPLVKESVMFRHRYR